ncbi:MAG: hypothetical protein AAF628_30815 [Planctomycetota bacterium]
MLNRHLNAQGEWRDGGSTRARITPVLGGNAVLEEWSGAMQPGQRMSGFSLRAFDPGADQWVILLNWSANGGSSFGRMRGGFRHGRGEFQNKWTEAGGGTVMERYTFSDALPTTVRWDQARSRDGGVTWRTDWIMEFSRTGAAAAQNFDRVMAEPWQRGDASPHAQARWLDFAVGRWAAGDAPGGAHRLRATFLGERRLIAWAVDRRAGDRWEPREFWVASYLPAAQAWEAWTLHAAERRFTRWAGQRLDSGALRFKPASADHARRVIIGPGPGGEDSLQWTEQQEPGEPGAGLGLGLTLQYTRTP